MLFNPDKLFLLPLGIEGDHPVDPHQPQLPNGIHLRWAPDPAEGFPWYGFYLFRRETEPSRPRCLSVELGRLRPGLLQDVRLSTSLGTLSSAKPLVFTKDFPPAGVVEVDLGQGAGLRFDVPVGVEARRVDLRVGLRDLGPQTTRTCVDFRPFPLGVTPSPRTEKGAVFTSQAPKVSPFIAVTSIEQWPGSPPGLQTTPLLAITLPCPATLVELLLTNRGELRIEGRSADGASTGAQAVKAQALTAGTVTLTGKAITQVIVTSPTVDPALLHQLCFACPAGTGGGPGKGQDIEVRALAGTSVVAHAVLQGNAGQVVAATLEGAGITAVEIAGGKAALVDLCVWPTKQGETFGWDEVPGFRYPLCLPVAEAGYPCPGKPTTFEDAKALAQARVTYPAPDTWNSDFLPLHDLLVPLVQGGPGAGPMATRESSRLEGTSFSPATTSPVTLPKLRPFDLLSLASLQPAAAQMIGLYFADTSVALGVAYDYLLLADPTGALGGSAATALAWLALTTGPTEVGGVLVRNRRTQTHPTIPSTGAPQAYVLPGAATRAVDGVLHPATGSVGLWWPLPPDSTEERPDQAIFYYPRRAELGTQAPQVRPLAAAYHPFRPDDTPLLVSEPEPSAEIGPRSSDWPPSQDLPASSTKPAQKAIPLHLVDGNLDEGWYSYRLVVQDLFGRRSDLGPEARWFEWDPPPEHPRHDYAVNLLDQVPPPIPLGVEAWALDPQDRWVLVDELYTKWRAANPSSLVGLRVRWRWTLLQQLQAPDTREFRIYYQPGRWNALLGRTVAVTATAADQSDVDLDLADTYAADAFAGARLRVGNDDFAILGSTPGAALRLRVKNLGAQRDVRPKVGKPCTVAIPENHKLWVDTSLSLTWSRRLAHAPYDPPAGIVIDPSKDAKGQVLTDVAFAAANLGTAVTLNGKIAQLPPQAALTGVQPWIDHLWIEDANQVEGTRRILEFDAQAHTVTVETPFTIGPPVHWTLGRPAREYEVFLPAPDVGVGHPFESSLAEPAVYAQIAVSAADDKTHAKDDPKWGSDPDRFGNESRLSPSATVFRVLQKAPPAPELVEKAGRIFATPADYHSRSYFTFRFVAQEHLKVHILRALDESLFRRDWLIRETRTALDPVPDPPDPPDPTLPAAKTEHLDFFPDDHTAWDFAKRKAAADKVNALATGAPYDSLTEDAWAVLALLPGNEGFAAKKSVYPKVDEPLKARDSLMRQTRAALTTITEPDSYSKLGDAELRTLAALPGNEAVFVQVTHEPLDMASPALKDERRPDDDAGYTVIPASRAYTDTLPGRATNRYFYRARFVDGAQNQSALSGPTLPVYLPKVEPPRAPVITKVVGGDRRITIYWQASSEPDVAQYLLYRATSAQAAGEVERMSLVHSEGAVVNPPEGPHWTDEPVPGRTTYFYRVAARSAAGLLSKPSAAVAAQAFDQTPPEPLPWVSAAWKTDGSGIELRWSTTGESLETLVLRQSGSLWFSISPWLPPGATEFVDSDAGADVANRYRLRVRNPSRNMNVKYLEQLVAPR